MRGLGRTTVEAGLMALLLASAAPLPAQTQEPISDEEAAALLDRPLQVTFDPAARPMPFELFRGTRIMFEGTVNGHPARMLFDSGASSTVINSSFARRIGMGDGRPVGVLGIGGRQQGALASGIRVQVGALTISDATMLMLDIDPIASRIGRPVDVILGAETFRAGIVDIDFPNRQMAFRPAAGFTPPTGAVATPVTFSALRRMIPISINGGPPVEADIDLGNGSALILARSAWAGSPMAHLPHAEATAGGVGGLVPMRLVTVPTVTVAGQTFQRVPAMLNTRENGLPETGANIGIDLLQRFRLLFDYDRRTLYMVPDRQAAAAPLPKNRHGMRLVLLGDRLRVDEVVAGSPAAAAGWRVGDEIVAVNGIAVDRRFYDREDSRFTIMAAGTRIALRRADGVEMPVTLRDFF